MREQLGIDVDVDHRNRMEMNGVFTWELGKGEHSRILFRKDGVEWLTCFILGHHSPLLLPCIICITSSLTLKVKASVMFTRSQGCEQSKVVR